MFPINAGLVLAAASLLSRGPGECSGVPHYEGGSLHGSICPDAMPSVTIIDLSDDWAPSLFGEVGDRSPAYRQRFVALANERFGDGPEWQSANTDRYFELFGIFPSFAVIRARLLDEDRHNCHAAVDDTSLLSTGATGVRLRPASIKAVQDHLRCERMLRGERAGIFDAPTRRALGLYQRRHMLPSAGTLDDETRQSLVTDSRELDFRTALRTLRERIVDATGLIEDGSARNAPERVLGRWIDSHEYRSVLRSAPLPNGAPDLISRATEAAAVELGWISAEATARAMETVSRTRTAVRLPPLPPYHGHVMQLRAEIDRGDVWTSFPLDAEGHARPSPVKNRPCLTLFAVAAQGEIALVRWPTTIGAWKPEKVDGQSEVLRYKPSPTGRWFWRELVAGPAWLPPPSTPDRELIRRGPRGWGPDADAIGPGYRSAFGLSALIHQRPVHAGTEPTYFDFGIRTHGSGNYRSVLRGSSHGCHRLFNHLALRLGSFVLTHAEHEAKGDMVEHFSRELHWRGRRFHLRLQSRGYLYVLKEPIPVDVLPGRIVRSRPMAAPPPATPALVPST